MSYFRSSASYGTTGTKTINVPFTPTGYRLTTSALFNGGDTSTMHYSEGFANSSAQRCHSLFSDSTGNQSIYSISKVLSHYERVSGVITEVLSLSHSSIGTSSISFTVNTANANYQVHIEVFG
jgi:hypothetical protein